MCFSSSFLFEFSFLVFHISFFLRYSPIGIWSLVSAKFAEMANIEGTFRSLGLFIVTVVTAIGFHSLVVLPIIYLAIVRKNPYKFMKGMLEAMATAFGTDSRYHF